MGGRSKRKARGAWEKFDRLHLVSRVGQTRSGGEDEDEDEDEAGEARARINAGVRPFLRSARRRSNREQCAPTATAHCSGPCLRLRSRILAGALVREKY